MPNYDLRCGACDKEYRISASVREKTEKLILCPDCGSNELETVFKSAPAYIKDMKHQQGCPNRSVCGGGGCRA
jgi:putative FmdB family regulatory protein